MISTSECIAVLLCGLSFYGLILFLLGRRPVIFLSFFFIIFSLVWRMSATMFIDLRGPVYSSQLVRDIGPGVATVLHSLAYIVTLIPFLYFFRKSAIESWRADARRDGAAGGEVSISDFTFVVSLVFLCVLFLDLVHRGNIPFFHHVERYNYAGGIAHRWMLRFRNFLTFWWGLMFAAGFIRERRLDWRMPALLCIACIYAFLTGNRFSAFYSMSSFFIMPWAASAALQYERADKKNFSWIRRTLGSRTRRVTAAGLAVILTCIISFAIYNNLANVQGYEGNEIWRQAFDRILIQPSEVGWTSFERVFESDQAAPSLVFHFLFEDPIDPSRNTSIQYLMFAAIGEPRTTDQVLHGFQLAGGFPEIFFELFGPYLAWPFLLAVGSATAALTAYVVRGTLRGDYLSAFAALYLLYGLYITYIGGMLNFPLVETYWIKIGLFVSALWLESIRARAGLPLVPWVLFRTPRAKFFKLFHPDTKQ